MSSELPYLPSTVEREQTRLQIPSRPDWIEPTVEYLKNRALLCGACPESRARKLQFALHEALTNSVVHGNLEIPSELKEREDKSFLEALAARAADPAFATRAVDIAVDYDGRRCRWCFTDQGRGFDVEKVLKRDADDEEALCRRSGRGIFMIRAFMDEVGYEAGGRRIVLTLKKPAADQRRQCRSSVHQPLRLVPVADDGAVDWDAAYEAVAHNLSTTGMAVLQARLTAPQRVIIALPGEDEPLYIPAEVRHCRTLTGNLMELGCHFQIEGAAGAETPTPARLEEALARLVSRIRAEQEAYEERRHSPRLAYNEPIGIAGAEGEPTQAFARDLSKGGIAFIAPAPLSPDVKVLSLPQAGYPPLRVRARVTRCDRIMDGFYDIGARFVGLDGE